MEHPAQRQATTTEDNTNTSTPRKRWYHKYILPLAVFCWPVLYLFTHVFPIKGQYTAIGNDFIPLYYRYKVYLLASLADLHFPFWAPSEAAGFPFYISPFPQAFYPLNLLLVVWYKLLGGYNPIDHQIFTVLGISIFALGLFMWLRLVNTNIRAVVFSVLVMSVSFKMTEILRFPNAVHSAAWYPWILYALTRILLSQSLRKAVLSGILLTLFLICLFTAGYPYYIYYSLFLFVPYILVFVIKPLRLRLLHVQTVHWKRVLGTLAVVGIVSLLICGPYLLGIKHLMSETTDRSGKDFKYSTWCKFSVEDSLGSLVYPPAAQAEGWYFFSITGFLLILMYLAGGKVINEGSDETSCFKEPVLASGIRADLWTKLFLVLWICLISYITYGAKSHLFILLWKFMPGFSYLRAWPRLNIILVPILAWLLSLAYASFESVISGKNADRKHPWVSSPITVAIAAYAVVLGFQLYMYLTNIYDTYWNEFFNHLSPQRIKFIVYGAVAFGAVLTIVILSTKTRFESSRSLTVVLIILVVVAVLEMRPVGMHIWTSRGRALKNRVNLDVAKINWLSFRFCRTDYGSTIPYTGNTIPLRPIFSVGIVPNWYFSRYTSFLKETEDEIDIRRTLLGVTDGRKVFFSESIKHPTIRSFLQDADRYKPAGQPLSYTGDELRWRVNAPVAGYLSFIDNWDQNWRVCVDDKPAEIELLFGTFKSVRLSEGLHQVRFYYRPKILPITRKAGP
jgi:hypothetical protein